METVEWLSDNYGARLSPTLGMEFRFGFYNVPAFLRMRAIREAGFDDVMLWWGGEYRLTDGAPQALFDAAGRCGLRVRTVHFPTNDTPSLWAPGLRGDEYANQLIAALKACGERGIENLVVHTTKKLATPPPSPIGAERMLQAAAAAERYRVNIALENTRFLTYNKYLYERVLSPRMKFCFDCGHANCFTPGEDPLALFSDRLVTMHLHDNNGPLAGDEHRLPGEGNINFGALAKRLAALTPAAYNLESRYDAQSARPGLTMAEYLSRAYRSLAKIAARENALIA